MKDWVYFAEKQNKRTDERLLFKKTGMIYYGTKKLKRCRKWNMKMGAVNREKGSLVSTVHPRFHFAATDFEEK